MGAPYRPRADPLIRKRKADVCALSEDTRNKLIELCKRHTIRDVATLIGASDNTVTGLLDPYGTASEKTIARLTIAIERESER